MLRVPSSSILYKALLSPVSFCPLRSLLGYHYGIVHNVIYINRCFTVRQSDKFKCIKRRHSGIVNNKKVWCCSLYIYNANLTISKHNLEFIFYSALRFVYILSDQGVPILSEGVCESLHCTTALEGNREDKGKAACTVLYSVRHQSTRQEFP